MGEIFLDVLVTRTLHFFEDIFLLEVSKKRNFPFSKMILLFFSCTITFESTFGGSKIESKVG